MNKIVKFFCLSFFTLTALAVLPVVSVSSAQAKSAKYGAVTGLPLPRFVSLRSSKVNARTGPALRYPIQWVYKRANLPVEITAEFDAWRQIKDIEGSVSWVHNTLLSGKRTAIIDYDTMKLETIPAFKKANIGSRKVLEVENSAIGEIKKCVSAFCLIDFKAYRGWVEKNYLWGIYPDEVIE